MAGSRTYKGRARPRPVTPRSSSEWTPTSLAGSAILADEVGHDADLFRSIPCLPQPQMADLSVGFGCLQPTLAEPSFEASRLELLFKKIDLTAERLALL